MSETTGQAVAVQHTARELNEYMAGRRRVSPSRRRQRSNGTHMNCGSLMPRKQTLVEAGGMSETGQKRLCAIAAVEQIEGE